MPPADGYIQIKNFTGVYKYGTVAKFLCNQGYQLIGDKSRYLKSDIQILTLNFEVPVLETGLDNLQHVHPSAVDIRQNWRMENMSF